MFILKDNQDQLDDPKSGRILTKAIIDTIQEPLLVLDEKLKIIGASKSFYKKFDLDPNSINDQMFYDLGGKGEWNIPALRVLLEEIIPKHKVVEDYEIVHDFEKAGPRALLINAREINYDNQPNQILISMFDVTVQRKLEFDNGNLSKQKDILLKEMRHRIANSLQIIASILLLKAQSVTSEETKAQLEDAHDRIMSIATVQGHLDPVGLGKEVNISTYLSALCQSLAASMIGNRRPLTIKVHAGTGKATTDEAIGLGLITTELVINSIKHAFIHKEKGEVIVEYEADDSNWRLAVKDNGGGMSEDVLTNRKGLGTGLIDTLAKQLNAIVQTESNSGGTIVSIIHKD